MLFLEYDLFYVGHFGFQLICRAVQRDQEKQKHTHTTNCGIHHFISAYTAQTNISQWLGSTQKSRSHCWCCNPWIWVRKICVCVCVCHLNRLTFLQTAVHRVSLRTQRAAKNSKAEDNYYIAAGSIVTQFRTDFVDNFFIFLSFVHLCWGWALFLCP